MKERLKITVLADEAEIPAGDPELSARPEKPTTEYYVTDTLRTLGHNVSVLGAGEDINLIIESLGEQNPDLVFNLTEHIGGDRRFDKNIAALLEMLKIPFTGSDMTGLLLSRDKRLCKQLLSLYRIRVPRFISLPHNKIIHVPKFFHFPLVVKPAFEDSSEGISNASKVDNEEALRERVQFIHQRWEQDAIAEEYVEGRELYVSILGNSKLLVLPIRQCHFNFNASEGPCLATYRVKWNEEYRKKWNIEYGFAELDSQTVKNIERTCKKVYRVLQLKDYARVDLRLTPDNKIVILEANSNPGLAYGEDVAEAAKKYGICYEDLIKRIISISLQRYV